MALALNLPLSSFKISNKIMVFPGLSQGQEILGCIVSPSFCKLMWWPIQEIDCWHNQFKFYFHKIPVNVILNRQWPRIFFSVHSKTVHLDRIKLFLLYSIKIFISRLAYYLHILKRSTFRALKSINIDIKSSGFETTSKSKSS